MKITKYFLSLAAAVGMIAGCQKQEMVQIAAPEDVVAPVLQDIDDIEITADNLGLESVTFEWNSADFGADAQIDYAVEVAKAGNAKKVAITSGITDTVSVVSYETLNGILIEDLQLESGEQTNVEFFISAKIGEYEKIYSAPVAVKVTATKAEKKYPKLYIVGSYNSWSHAVNQYIFDFAGEDQVYQGIIDFGLDHASNEFKITAGGWGVDEHSMNGAHEAEAKKIAMVKGGGDNINVWREKRFYHLTFDRALTMAVNVSFDQIGVIGDFNTWGGDVVMKFNTSNQKFFADVEFAAAGGFKFRLDGKWDISYGSKTPGILDSGDNISAPAGNYRIYLNMNNFGQMKYELNAEMYGVEEPGYVEPVAPDEKPEVEWYLIGAFNGWKDADENYKMTKGDEYYEFKNLVLESSSLLQFNVGSWSDKRSGTFAKDAAIDAAAGSDMTVPAGTYDVYMNLACDKIYFMTPGKTPADAGEAVVTYIDASSVNVGISGSFGEENGATWWKDPAGSYQAAFGSKELTDGTTYAGTYVYNLTGLTLSNGTSFKLRINGSWIGYSDVTFEGLNVIEGDGGNIQANEGGTFNVEISFTWDGLTHSEVKAKFSK